MNKKALAALTAALMLTGCASETQTDITEPSADTSETSAEAQTHQTETAAETEAEKDPESPKFTGGFDARTLYYMNSLLDCEAFSEMLENKPSARIMDMNGDLSPEIILSIPSETSAAVFSLNESGAFLIPPSAGSDPSVRSYDGGSLESYLRDGEHILLTRSQNDENPEIVKVTFNGKELSADTVCACDSNAADEYMADCEYSGFYIAANIDLNENYELVSLRKLASELDNFYQYADTFEMLNDDIPREIRFLTTYSEHSYIPNDISSKTIRYDGAGNIMYNNSDSENEYKYGYYPDGTVKSIIILKDGVRKSEKYFDEHGNDVNDYCEYNENGQLIKKKKHNGRIEIYSYNPDGSLADTVIIGGRETADETDKTKRHVYIGNVEQVYYKSGDAPEYLLSETTYDENGNKLSVRTFTEDGKTFRLTEYAYNENGDLISEKCTHPDGIYEPSDKIQEYEYICEYDGRLLISETFKYWETTVTHKYVYDKRAHSVPAEIYETFAGRFLPEYGEKRLLTEIIMTVEGEDDDLNGFLTGEYRNYYSNTLDLKGNPVRIRCTSDSSDDYQIICFTPISVIA